MCSRSFDNTKAVFCYNSGRYTHTTYSIYIQTHNKTQQHYKRDYAKLSWYDFFVVTEEAEENILQGSIARKRLRHRGKI